MPIDPSIALSAQGLGPIKGLSEAYDEVERYRAERENARALQEQRKAIAEQRIAQTEKLQRDAQKEAEGGAALDEFLQTYEPGKPMPTAAVGKMYRNYGPERTSAIVKGVADLHTADLTSADGMRKSMTTRLAALKALPEDRREAGYGAVVNDYVSKGVVKPEEVAPYSPEVLDNYERQLLSNDKRYDIEHPKPVEHDPTHDLLNPQTGAVIVPGKAKEPTKPASAQEYEYAKTQGYKGSYEQYQNEDANRKRSVVNVGAPGGAGALDEDGVDYAATEYRITGKMPALGMGNGSARAAIINGAAKQSKLLNQTPANAIQKQAAFKSDAKSLDQIRKLSTSAEAFEQKALGQADIVSDLSAKVGRTSWPVLNAAILAGKTEVAGDKDATLLLNAITTFSAEYGKIIEGSTGSVSGSSDSARHAAEKLISAKMSKGTLQGALDLMKREMSLTRQGYDFTINHITDRMGGAPPAPAPGAVPAPAGGDRIRVKGPNGETGTVPAGTALPAGWSKAGG